MLRMTVFRKFEVCASYESSVVKSPPSPSRKTLPAMLGRPHRMTRFDRLTTDICRKRGTLKTEKSKHKKNNFKNG